MSEGSAINSRPLLLTERLELWQPVASDLPGLLDLTFDGETRRFLGPSLPSERDSGERLLRNAGSWALFGYGTFAVRWRGRDRIIGSCGLFHTWRGFGKGMDDVPEAGWIMHRDVWGRGVASEAMVAILAWFDAEHGRRRTVCMIEEDHAVSDKLARKLGYAPYDTEELDDGAVVALYERL